jgi:hypothetical protein
MAKGYIPFLFAFPFTIIIIIYILQQHKQNIYILYIQPKLQPNTKYKFNIHPIWPPLEILNINFNIINISWINDILQTTKKKRCFLKTFFKYLQREQQQKIWKVYNSIKICLPSNTQYYIICI